jgi:hypothetical protein
MLTTPQQQIIKSLVQGDSTLNAIPNGPDGAFAISEALSLNASPDFIVWKSDVDPNEVMKNGMDWTQVDNLSAGKARIWEWLTKLGFINAAKPNVRAGIDATWTGNASMLAVRTAVYVHCKRKASRLEKALSTGTGTDVSPATMGYEGTVSYLDVMQLMGW